MIEHIRSANDPRLADYRDLPDGERLRVRGLFVAEGRLVVRRLLGASRFRTRSVLVTPTAHRPLADVLDGREALPVYVARQALVNAVTGFNFHRGCLAIGERQLPSAAQDLYARPEARLLLVLEGVSNADNVGAAFRNAAAFGVDGVLLAPGCCDPLYRKAIRTSMGAVLAMPFAMLPHWPAALDDLRAHRWTVVGLTPAADALDLTTYQLHGWPPRVALLVGTEGPGLTAAARRGADILVRIPLAPGVDSLNVATAAAIALHGFRAAESPRAAADPPPAEFHFAS